MCDNCSQYWQQNTLTDALHPALNEDQIALYATLKDIHDSAKLQRMIPAWIKARNPHYKPAACAGFFMPPCNPQHFALSSRTMAFPAKLADLDDDQAIAEIASGSFLKHIAARYGVAKQSLHERLKKHPAWRTAVAMQAETLVESATSEAMGLGDGATMPDIARARV